MASTPQSRFVRVNGINMHYLEWGQLGAPDLLLVHGWSSWAQSWSWLAERLQGTYHIIAPDHRGHGESDKPTTGYLLRDFVEDMRQLIAALGLRRPLYAGNSWGGCIGTILAADYPNDITKAFLGDPVCWKMINAFVTSLPSLLARRKRPDDDLRAEMRGAGLKEEEIETELVRLRKFSEDALTRLLTDNRDFAFRCEEYLRRIQVPTLIIAADPTAGGFILNEEADYIEGIASPRVRVVRWSGVGHGVLAARPDRYLGELQAFFAT